MILFLSNIVVNLVLCITYKLNFLIGIYVLFRKKNSIFGIWYYLWIQASSRCLDRGNKSTEMCLTEQRGGQLSFWHI